MDFFFWYSLQDNIAMNIFYLQSQRQRHLIDNNNFGSVFLKEVIGIWEEVDFVSETTSKDHSLDQQIWHNSLTKIANKTGIFLNWFTKGILLG